MTLLSSSRLLCRNQYASLTAYCSSAGTHVVPFCLARTGCLKLTFNTRMTDIAAIGCMSKERAMKMSYPSKGRPQGPSVENWNNESFGTNGPISCEWCGTHHEPDDIETHR